VRGFYYCARPPFALEHLRELDPDRGRLCLPGLGMHGDACVGPDDCILLNYNNKKADFIPKQ
jgi:hypothetical protein